MIEESKKRPFQRVSSSPTKRPSSPHNTNNDKDPHKPNKKLYVRKYNSNSVNLPVNNLQGFRTDNKPSSSSSVASLPPTNNKNAFDSNSRSGNATTSHDVLKETSYSAVTKVPQQKRERPSGISSSKPAWEIGSQNDQLDQIYWSSSDLNGKKNRNLSPLGSPVRIRDGNYGTKGQSASRQSLSKNDENVDSRFDGKTLPNLKVDPISVLEKKYKTNFALTNQTPSSKKMVADVILHDNGSIKTNQHSSNKHLHLLNFNTSTLTSYCTVNGAVTNSYATPSGKSPLSKKSKSLSLCSSKLFSKIGSDHKRKPLGGSSDGNVNSKKNSLKELLSELKNSENSPVTSTNNFNNVGNTTSEILDKGISLDNYQRDDFTDDFFDESMNSSIKEPILAVTKEAAAESQKLEPVINDKSITSIQKTASNIVNDDFDDEFSSDDDFEFDELQKKIGQKSQSITIDSGKLSTDSSSNIAQSTPTKDAVLSVTGETAFNGIGANKAISVEPEGGQPNIASNENDNDSSDFSIDEEEEDQLLNKLTQKKFSTQQITKIKETDLAGAAIFSKNMSDELLELEEKEEEKSVKDVFADVNMAKIAVERSWLHRFQILEIIEKQYTFKGIKKDQLILKVKDKNANSRNIAVRDAWLLTSYDVGEIIHVIGENPTVIDSERNFIILNPDTLLSATTLGESMNCERKSALLARYKMPGESSKALIVGNIVHEIMQKCMVERETRIDFVNSVLETATEKFILDILSIGETKESISTECWKHLGYVIDWVGKYINADVDKDSFSEFTSSITTFGRKEEIKFRVSKVLDVEESIWSPIFGLRGLIDATIEATIKDGDKVGTFVAPLEIKTGKDYLSHKAQTSLYTLLMKDRYEMDVNFFVLVYTKFFQTTKYEIDKRDLRMLLIKRNSLSKYLKQIQPELPPLVKNSFCDRCYVKDVCMTYNKLVEDGSEETSGFKPGEFTEATEHLGNPQYGEFYMYWEDLLNKEENFIAKLNKELWIFTAKEREKSGGKALCDLKVKEVTFDPSTEYYTYVFERKETRGSGEKYSPMTWSQLSHHDHVIVSDEKGHFAISSGFVLMIREGLIKISTRRRLDHSNLRLPDFDATKNQSFQSVVNQLNSTNMNTGGNLAADELKLLTISSEAEPRYYRIDKNPAFHGLQLARYNMLDLFIKGGNIMLRDLLVCKQRIPPSPTPLFDYHTSPKFNSDQATAMKKCFSTNDFALILGMPGTGKTTTITEIIKQLVNNGKSVLIASYTHSAIDNILIKLKESNMTNFVRLGSINKIHPTVQEYSPLSSKFKIDITDSDSLHKAYMSPSVVAITCLGITDWVFNQRRFDYCIIDEASQVSMPICLGPLRFADKFILVGDHYQLPPLIVAPSARKGLQRSLFRFLSEEFPDSVVELSHQYRMCEDIMMLSNTLIYSGRLKCGSKSVAGQVLQVPNPENIKKHITSVVTIPSEAWMETVFEPRNRVMFLDHDNIGNSSERIIGDKVDNPVEAQLISQIVEGLIAGGVSESSIGVMSLYRAQIRLLNSHLYSRRNVEILTADRFQGLDKDCIIISLVRSNDKQITGELLREWRRVNVAITRAKSKLILVGSKKTLQGLATIDAFLKILESRGWVYHLPHNAVACYEFLFQAATVGTAGTTGTLPSQPRSLGKETTKGKLSQKLIDNHLLLKNIIDDAS